MSDGQVVVTRRGEIDKLAQIRAQREKQASSLERFENVHAAIEHADSLSEIVSIHSFLEAFRKLQAEYGLSDEQRREAAIAALKAVRRGGQMLLGVPEGDGGEWAREVPQGGEPVSRQHAIEQAGLTKGTAYRWMRIGAVPDVAWEEYLTSEDDWRWITLSGALRLAADEEDDPPPQDTPGFDPGPWRTITIDPPWPMQKIHRDERPIQRKSLDYPTWTVDQIRDKLPIEKLADPRGAHVYLWTTHRFLPDALDLFQAWNVRYECVLTWWKNVGPTPFSWMYDTELILFGRAGKALDLTAKGKSLVVRANASGHSWKPEAFYERHAQTAHSEVLGLLPRLVLKLPFVVAGERSACHDFS